MLATACVSGSGGESVEFTLEDVLLKLSSITEQVAVLETTAATYPEKLKNLEAIIGPVDADQSGDISTEEAEKAFDRTVIAAGKNPEAAEYLTDLEFWKAIGAYAAAAWLTKKYGDKVPVLNSILAILKSLGTKKGTPPQDKTT